MRYLFRWHRYCLTCLWIAPVSRRSVVQREAPDTADFYPISPSQRLAHPFQDGLDREFSVFGGELGEVWVCGEANDEFGTGHADILRGLPGSNDQQPLVERSAEHQHGGWCGRRPTSPCQFGCRSLEKRFLFALWSERGDAPHIPELFVRKTSEIALFNTVLSQEPSEDDKQLRVTKVVLRVDLTSGFRQVFLD